MYIHTHGLTRSPFCSQESRLGCDSSVGAPHDGRHSGFAVTHPGPVGVSREAGGAAAMARMGLGAGVRARPSLPF